MLAIIVLVRLQALTYNFPSFLFAFSDNFSKKFSGWGGGVSQKPKFNEKSTNICNWVLLNIFKCYAYSLISIPKY